MVIRNGDGEIVATDEYILNGSSEEAVKGFKAKIANDLKIISHYKMKDLPALHCYYMSIKNMTIKQFKDFVNNTYQDIPHKYINNKEAIYQYYSRLSKAYEDYMNAIAGYRFIRLQLHKHQQALMYWEKLAEKEKENECIY